MQHTISCTFLEPPVRKQNVWHASQAKAVEVCQVNLASICDLHSSAIKLLLYVQALVATACIETLVTKCMLQNLFGSIAIVLVRCFRQASNFALYCGTSVACRNTTRLTITAVSVLQLSREEEGDVIARQAFRGIAQHLQIHDSRKSLL